MVQGSWRGSRIPDVGILYHATFATRLLPRPRHNADTRPAIHRHPKTCWYAQHISGYWHAPEGDPYTESGTPSADSEGGWALGPA